MASFGVDLASSKWGAGLKPDFRRGFVYADARVDDARLVVANVLDARARGADVRVRTKLVAAERERSVEPPFWRLTLRDGRGNESRVSALALVNATGPWVKEVRDLVNGVPSVEKVRHVKGSHIVVPRVHPEEHAYILQNVDQRVVFVIPYEDRYSLIGTTDVPVEAFERPADHQRRNRVPAHARQPLSRTAADRRRHRVDVCRHSPAVRRRRVGPLGDHARLRASRSTRLAAGTRRSCRSTAARSPPTASSPSTR